MLTKELLNQNDAIKNANLSEEVVAAILKLSIDDESKVIAKRIAKFWTDIDNDIKSITGAEKPALMKSFDFMKAELKKQYESAKNAGDTSKLTEEINTLKKEKSDLEEKIKNGKGGEALKLQIEKLETTIKDKDNLIKKWEDTSKEWEGKFNDEVSTNLDNRINSHIATMIAHPEKGLKFKKGIPQVAIDAVLETNIAKLKSDYKIGFEGKNMVFRDQNGELQYNSNDGNNPHTAISLLSPLMKDVIDTTGQGGGGSRKPGQGGGGTSTALTDSANRGEFATNLKTYLTVEKGLVVGSSAYITEHNKQMEDHQEFLADLPSEGSEQ